MKLLETLCSSSALLVEQDASEEEEERTKVLAWGAFRVLSDCCVRWDDGKSNLASSGLARQVRLPSRKWKGGKLFLPKPCVYVDTGQLGIMAAD